MLQVLHIYCDIHRCVQYVLDMYCVIHRCVQYVQMCMYIKFDVHVYMSFVNPLPGVAYSTCLSWDEGRTKPQVQINCWVTSNGKGKAAASNFLDY